MSNSAASKMIKANLKRRYKAERRFRVLGGFSVLLGFLFLIVLFFNIISAGWPAIQQTYIKLEIEFDAEVLELGVDATAEDLSRANYEALVKVSLARMFPDVSGRRDKRALTGLVSSGRRLSAKGDGARKPKKDRDPGPRLGFSR